MEIHRNTKTRQKILDTKPTASNLIRKLTASELSKFGNIRSIQQVATICDKIHRNANRRVWNVDEPFVVCNGGLGDVVLGIAASYANNKCKLIHASNVGMQSIIEQFVKAFEIPAEIRERPFTTEEFDTLSKSHWCKSTCHLPLHLDYKYWSDSDKFTNMPRSIPLFDLFGRHDNLVPKTKGMIAICPRGSNSPACIESQGICYKKSREISVEEYRKLAKKFLRRNTVIVIGSNKDLQQYGMIDHSHFFWLTFDKLINYKGNETPVAVKTVLSIVNACKLIISVDTWLKTYAGIAGLPTIVLRTRFNDGYLDQQIDLSENIFLNKKMWDFRINKIEDIA